jgi:moderate conductance mechanosensitive channel
MALDPQQLVDACGTDPGWVCERVLDVTDRTWAATLADWLVDRPVKIVIVLVLALVLRRVLHRLIEEFVERVRTGSPRPLGSVLPAEPGLRAAQRADTLAAVLRSGTTIVVWTLALLVVLGEIGIQLGPLIAGAGVAGVALGFGAQSLVKDFLSGIFMLVEDQYGVGDVIDVGEATGVVERVSLRTTRLRDVEGTVWHVPNGQILRVGNKSQDWARSLIDVSVALDTDVGAATDVLLRVASGLREDPVFGLAILEDPEVWGVERLAADGLTIRLAVKTKPGDQWRVARELRARLKVAFAEAGVAAPVPLQVIRVESPSTPSQEEPR